MADLLKSRVIHKDVIFCVKDGGRHLSAEIIRINGGKIWAESVVGKGSTFFFRCRWLNHTTILM
jgi:hypothetical protein